MYNSCTLVIWRNPIPTLIVLPVAWLEYMKEWWMYAIDLYSSRLLLFVIFLLVCALWISIHHYFWIFPFFNNTKGETKSRWNFSSASSSIIYNGISAWISKTVQANFLETSWKFGSCQSYVMKGFCSNFQKKRLTHTLAPRLGGGCKREHTKRQL